MAFMSKQTFPLRGAAGFLDWRLCGALSHAFEQGEFQGHAGEVMMMPLWGRVGTRRLFIFGGCPPRQGADAITKGCRAALKVMGAAGCTAPIFMAPVLASPEGNVDQEEQEFYSALQQLNDDPLLEGAVFLRVGSAR